MIPIADIVSIEVFLIIRIKMSDRERFYQENAVVSLVWLFSGLSHIKLPYQNYRRRK